MENDNDFFKKVDDYFAEIGPDIETRGEYYSYLQGVNKAKELLQEELQKLNDYANTTHYLLEKANERIAEQIVENHDLHLQFEILRVENEYLKKDRDFYRTIVEFGELKFEVTNPGYNAVVKIDMNDEDNKK